METKNPRHILHKLIGDREKCEKRADFGSSKAQDELPKFQQAVKDFLKVHPELDSEVEKIEEHFFKILYKE